MPQTKAGEDLAQCRLLLINCKRLKKKTWKKKNTRKNSSTWRRFSCCNAHFMYARYTHTAYTAHTTSREFILLNINRNISKFMRIFWLRTESRVLSVVVCCIFLLQFLYWFAPHLVIRLLVCWLLLLFSFIGY